MDGTSFFSIIIFSGIIALAIVIGVVSLKFILTFSTTMLLIGFYFTPSVVGRTIIAILIAVKYWFFFFWIKTEDVENG